ncbi:MAG TPA: hypothetical protein VIJ00_02710 [Nakamurella sp.]
MDNPFDPVTHNRAAWDQLVAAGNEWTRPVSPELVAQARSGDRSIVLIGHQPVDPSWFPPTLTGVDVLCLAGGGGQQGPVLAAAGARVTAFDNSPAAATVGASRAGLIHLPARGSRAKGSRC